MNRTIKPTKTGAQLVIALEHNGELRTFTKIYSSITSASLGVEKFVEEINFELSQV